MKVIKPVILIIASIIASAALVMAVSAAVCAYSLKETYYEVPVDGIDSELKVVCISDLHSKEYGKDNKRLIQIIGNQNPDAVFVVGDMIDYDADDEDVQRFLNLTGELCKISPVFFSAGNHEVVYMKEHGEDLLNAIAETGATALYDSFVETEIAGNTIRIGGTCGHYRSINWKEKYDYAMQEEIGSSDVASVVLMHMPENMLSDGARKKWNADLYISGHTHGGVVRLPFIGGLAAPTQGFFPKYYQGQFLIDRRLNLIITSGLSGYDWVPRIFNRPEICVITLKPA